MSREWVIKTMKSARMPRAYHVIAIYIYRQAFRLRVKFWLPNNRRTKSRNFYINTRWTLFLVHHVLRGFLVTIEFFAFNEIQPSKKLCYNMRHLSFLPLLPLFSMIRYTFLSLFLFIKSNHDRCEGNI